MVNKKGFELALSTIVLLILGILILIGLVIFINGGFKQFRDTTEPFAQTAETAAVKEACNIACLNSDRLAYCCREFNVGEESVKCEDERLEVSCGLSCEGFAC